MRDGLPRKKRRDSPNFEDGLVWVGGDTHAIVRTSAAL